MIIHDDTEQLVNDEAARLAGLLVLILHLHDIRAGYVIPRRDHIVLARYGYDMAGCECNTHVVRPYPSTGHVKVQRRLSGGPQGGNLDGVRGQVPA